MVEGGFVWSEEEEVWGEAAWKIEDGAKWRAVVEKWGEGIDE